MARQFNNRGVINSQLSAFDGSVTATKLAIASATGKNTMLKAVANMVGGNNFHSQSDAQSCQLACDDFTLTMDSIGPLPLENGTSCRPVGPDGYRLRDNVKCRQRGGEWEAGVVTSTSPLEVRPHGWSKSFPWDEVKHHDFQLHEIVKCRFNSQEKWQYGMVTQISPLQVHPSFSAKSYSYDEVERHGFQLGEKVRCRVSGQWQWKCGKVTSTSPLKVNGSLPNRMDTGYEWDEIDAHGYIKECTCRT